MNDLQLKHFQKLNDFIKERMEKDIYPETPMEPHISITKEMITKLNNLKPLSDCDVLDVGCGQGFALEIFKQTNANAVGITFGEDFRICKKKASSL
jgi:2-polyprenyl-3-methyl-5-hydroxy-6-metoxy-1,4-benzoquinol methylase